MGKKATFGIEYAVVSNIKEVLKGYIKNYKTLLADKRPIEAAQAVIEATETVLDESDKMNDQQDPDVLYYLSTMAIYCKKAIRLLEDRQDSNLLVRYIIIVYIVDLEPDQPVCSLERTTTSVNVT